MASKILTLSSIVPNKPTPPSLEAVPALFTRLDSPWSTASLDNIALPPASHLRQIKKLANDNLSNGFSLFVHYVQPTLTLRRDALIDSGTTAKKFYKTTGKLWQDLPPSQKAFWNGEAARLRHDLKQKVISHEACIRCVGSPAQWDKYIGYAEMAVAEYLGIPLPLEATPQDSEQLTSNPKCEEKQAVLTTPSPYIGYAEMAAEMATAEHLCIPLPCTASPQDSLQQSDSPQCHEKQVMPTTPTMTSETSPPASINNQELLDTLPGPFLVEPRMLYGHFAHYNLSEILTTPTRKRQLEKLHQLADLFDQTGKVLFYYYVYPRLWKQLRPLGVDENIAIFAQEIWRQAEGFAKEEWRAAELEVKKMLGDGDVNGLELLRLDGLHPEVLRLHGMAEEAVKGRLEEVKRDS